MSRELSLSQAILWVGIIYVLAFLLIPFSSISISDDSILFDFFVRNRTLSVIIGVISVLTSGILLSVDSYRFKLFSSRRDYTIAVIYCALFSVCIGCEEFLVISLWSLFILIALHVLLSNSFFNELIPAKYFKLALLNIMLAELFHPYVWLSVVLIVMVFFFRGHILMDSIALLLSYFSLMLVAIWLHWWIYGDIQGYLIDSQNDILNLFDINVEYSLKGLVIGSYVLISFLIFFFLYQSGVNYLNNLSKRLFSFCMWLFVIAIIWIRVKIDIFSVGAFALPLSVYLTYTIKNIGNVHIKRVIVGVLIVFLVFCATIHYWS